MADLQTEKPLFTDMDRSFGEELARTITGKSVLVTLTFLGEDATVEHTLQYFGTVLSCNADDGVTIRETGGTSTIFLPPDLRSVEFASKGKYTLHPTGEHVVNPDIIISWVVYHDGKMQSVPAGRKFYVHFRGHHSFYGTGTMLYGHRNYHPDGSFITTKWLTLFYLPLLPVASYRILKRPARGVHGGIIRIQQLPLNLRRVALGYLIVIPLLLAVVYLALLSRGFVRI